MTEDTFGEEVAKEEESEDNDLFGDDYRPISRSKWNPPTDRFQFNQVESRFVDLGMSEAQNDG
jgi:hypothetical protein